MAAFAIVTISSGVKRVADPVHWIAFVAGVADILHAVCFPRVDGILYRTVRHSLRQALAQGKAQNARFDAAAQFDDNCNSNNGNHKSIAAIWEWCKPMATIHLALVQVNIYISEEASAWASGTCILNHEQNNARDAR